MSRRGRYRNVFRDILDACTEKRTLSSVLQKCGLSCNHEGFLVYLNHCGYLKKKGFLYETTDEGRAFLREFERLLQKLDI